MKTIEFNIDKPAPSKALIEESLSQSTAAFVKANKRYALIFSFLSVGFALFVAAYLYQMGGVPSPEPSPPHSPGFSLDFFIHSMIGILLLVLSSLMRAEYYSDSCSEYNRKSRFAFMLGLTRDASRFLVFMSVFLLMYSAQIEYSTILLCLIPVLISLFLFSILIDRPFLLYRDAINACTDSSEEDCLQIQYYMIYPEIDAYRRSVVEQGRDFVNGDLEEMRDKYYKRNREVNAIKEEKCLKEARQKIYQIAPVNQE